MNPSPFLECPKNLMEFEERSGTEEACREYFLDQRRRSGFPFPETKDQEAREIERSKFKEI
jgi:hypothetical protein